MFEAFAVVQIVICILLVVIILLQEGKKGMGAIFGGSSSSVFGARGAGNILTKITSVLAILFMLNSVWMSYISSSDKSVVKIEQQAEKTTPAPVAAQPAEEKKPEAAEQKNEQKEAPVEEQKPAEEQKEAPAE
ncbi:preprotein translocase subunit SecG [bacterium]|jgi:preprotein translocase subunit SecG|nr:preprotein translocase subunit SecG [bacterium]